MEGSHRHKWVGYALLGAILIAAAAVYLLQRRGKTFEGWSTDLEATLAEAKRDGRPVLAYFVESQSGRDAQQMAGRTLARQANKRILAELDFLRVVVATATDSDLARRYGLTTLPVLMVLSPDGRECQRDESRYIGELQFRTEFLEPKLSGWASHREVDVAEFTAKAHAAGRPVLVLFARPASSNELRRLAFATLARDAAREAIARTGAAKLVVRIVSTDHALARQYGVTALPALVLIPPAGEPARHEGFIDVAGLIRFLAPVTTAPAAGN